MFNKLRSCELQASVLVLFGMGDGLGPCLVSAREAGEALGHLDHGPHCWRLSPATFGSCLHRSLGGPTRTCWERSHLLLDSTSRTITSLGLPSHKNPILGWTVEMEEPHFAVVRRTQPMRRDLAGVQGRRMGGLDRDRLGYPPECSWSHSVCNKQDVT